MKDSPVMLELQISAEMQEFTRAVHKEKKNRDCVIGFVWLCFSHIMGYLEIE